MKIFHAPAYFWAPALFAIWTLAAFGLGSLLGFRASWLRCRLGLVNRCPGIALFSQASSLWT